MCRLGVMLKTMPAVEGENIASLEQVEKLDKVGFNLIMAHFAKNVRMKGSDTDFS